MKGALPEGGSMIAHTRRHLAVALALVQLGTIVGAEEWHLAAPSRVEACLVEEQSQRRERVQALRDLLSTKQAEEAVALGIRVSELRDRIPHLSDTELQDLSR